jgi:hypothetical protein
VLRHPRNQRSAAAPQFACDKTLDPSSSKQRSLPFYFLLWELRCFGQLIEEIPDFGISLQALNGCFLRFGKALGAQRLVSNDLGAVRAEGFAAAGGMAVILVSIEHKFKTVTAFDVAAFTGGMCSLRYPQTGFAEVCHLRCPFPSAYVVITLYIQCNAMSIDGQCIYKIICKWYAWEMANRKADSIFIRVSEEEKAAYVEGAAADERPLSDWLRSLARKRLKELQLPVAKGKTEKGEERPSAA